MYTKCAQLIDVLFKIKHYSKNMVASVRDIALLPSGQSGQDLIHILQNKEMYSNNILGKCEIRKHSTMRRWKRKTLQTYL